MDYPIVFYNVFVLSVFAVLAYVFAKWWIVLFAILFIAVSGDEESKEVQNE